MRFVRPILAAVVLLLGGLELCAQEPETLPPVQVEAPRVPPPPAPPPPAPPPAQPSLPASPFTPPAVTGYRADSSVTATGTNTPLLNVPASISIVPEALIADQQALTTADLLRNVPGAVVSPSPTTRFNQFTLRGFTVSDAELRRNGFVDFSLVPRELANIERVEFLKGPASMLYGGGQPGGLINFITKMPQAQPYRSAELEIGSFDLYRFVGDATGPVLGSESLFFRTVVALEDTNSFRDFVFLQRLLVSPSLTWVVDRDTTLTVQGEFYATKLFFDTGVVAPGGNVRALPINRSLNEPGDDAQELDYRVTAFFDHRFGDDWALRLGVQSLWLPAEIQRTIPAAFLTPDTVIRVQQSATTYQEQYHSLIANLTGKLETGPLQHQTLVGMELGWLWVPDFTLRQSNPFVTPLLLNIYDPVYESPAFGAPNPPLPFRIDLVQNQTRYGAYAQDLIDYDGRLQLLFGARYDAVHEQFEAANNVPLGFPVTGITPLAEPRRSRNDPTYYHVSPRAGIVWQPMPQELALYASYSQFFNPLFGATTNDQPLVPETGYQWEGGVKADLLDRRLSFTAAGFYILKDNAAVPDPTVDFIFFRQLGQQRSQGAEASLVGQLTSDWSIVANYAYIDARILQDGDTTLVGKRLMDVPFNSAGVWTRYNVMQRPDQTLGAALGLVWVGERPGDLANSFELPSYTRWDAGLYYQRHNLSLSLYLENLFDIQYYTGSVSAFQIYPGAPFNVRGALRWTF